MTKGRGFRFSDGSPANAPRGLHGSADRPKESASYDVSFEVPRELPDLRQGQDIGREDAATILAVLADVGRRGHWPNGVTPHAIGLALSRIGVNYPLQKTFIKDIVAGLEGKPPVELEDEEV